VSSVRIRHGAHHAVSSAWKSKEREPNSSHRVVTKPCHTRTEGRHRPNPRITTTSVVVVHDPIQPRSAHAPHARPSAIATAPVESSRTRSLRTSRLCRFRRRSRRSFRDHQRSLARVLPSRRAGRPSAIFLFRPGDFKRGCDTRNLQNSWRSASPSISGPLGLLRRS
jgi:hypothetical protein